MSTSPLLLKMLAFAVFGLVALGQYSVTRAVLSELHRRPMPDRLWRCVVVGVLAASAAVPIWMLSEVGLHGARLLVSESDWSRVGMGWAAYGAACVAMLVFGVVQEERRRRRVEPAAQTGMSVRRVDIGGMLERLPRGRGMGAALAWVPGNEIFEVDVIQRRLKLERAAGLGGFKVLHLSDLHLNGTPDLTFFEKAVEMANELKPDMVALTGDVLDTEQVSHWFASTLGQLKAPLGCYYVLGNHDADSSPEVTRRMLGELGWVDVAGRCVGVEVGGEKLWVGGTELPWMGTEAEFPTASEGGFRMLLSHGPDPVIDGRCAGVDLVLAGHLHGGQICLPVLGPVKSAPYLAGIYECKGTVLHMSRGLGEMTQLRWGCRPEMTVLEIV